MTSKPEAAGTSVGLVPDLGKRPVKIAFSRWSDSTGSGSLFCCRGLRRLNQFSRPYNKGGRGDRLVAKLSSAELRIHSLRMTFMKSSTFRFVAALLTFR